jgi:hypothetical protein
MTNTYYLTSKRLNGYIEVEYIDGIINAVKTALNEPLKEKQFEVFTDKVPMYEKDLGQLNLIGLHANRLLATNEKIALFCALYERYKKVKYQVSGADTGKIKLVKLDEAMLDHYFQSDNFLFRGKHSISNLVKYFNELRAECAAPKHKYPDYFEKTFQDKLKQGEEKFYWAHLRSIGLEPQKDRFGIVTDWVKKKD